MASALVGDELLLRLEEVAQHLRISRANIYRLINSGEIPVIRFGASVRVSRRALEAWIDGKSGYDLDTA